MPGTPAQSPRFDIPRYADTDAASFSAQVNAITDGFDAAVAKRLIPNILAGSATVADHQVVVAGASETVTLPAPSSEHELICVYAKDDVAGVSGSAPVTIVASSGKIYGKGLGVAGVTSIALGTPGAFVWLFSADGTNWKIVHGEQNTGWVAITPAAGMSGTAQYRVRGDEVELSGSLENQSGSTLAGNSPLATNLPAANAAATGFAVEVAASIAFNSTTLEVAFFSSLANGSSAYLDGFKYRLHA